MIDLHCHILPGIDDGPPDLDVSVGMARLAVNDGISHIVATPHFSHGEKDSVENIDNAFAILDRRLRAEGIPVRLLRGADIRLTYELLAGIESGDIPTINGSRYFLIELPDIIPPNLDRFLFTAKLKGFVPIITHPERNHSLLSTPEKMEMLHDAGTFFQITAMSITGEFGNSIKRFSHMLLKKGFVDFIATDAHNTVRRPPVMSKAYKEISGILDREKTRRIFFDNPQYVIEDREIIR